MSDTAYSDTYTEYEDAGVEDTATPAAAQDVATLIANGLADLETLKAKVSEAESRTESIRTDADSIVAAAKERAQETIAAARAEATAAVEAVKAEQDEKVAAVREEANAEVAAVKTEQDALVADIATEVSDANAAYAARINELIDTGWATTGSLASLGHQVPRQRGGRKKK